MITISIQWIILVAFGVAFFLMAPLSKSVPQFFSAASKSGKQPNTFLLTSSLVISWIFAKSITVASNLGLEFGMVGGVSYAVYYLSFLVAGVVIYRLRVIGGYTSIHDFLQTKFGRSAVIVFSVLVGIRLFNEVWSNTMVIGSYFGDAGSIPYYTAILVFTGLTIAYTLKGGLRSSLLTDAIQMMLFGILLFVVLGLILPREDSGTVVDYVQSGTWSMSTGMNLFFVAMIQIFSYPFHDSVMTDRGFIADAWVTLKSFLLAGLIGFVCILLFSLVGVYGQMIGVEGQAAVEVSKVLGVGAMLIINFIMITSAASTLDSTFSSSAKLVVMDLGSEGFKTVGNGRLVMVLFMILGTLPIFANPEILSATTVSGTMVLGLAPVFIFWRSRSNTVGFHLAVATGIVFGVILATGSYPDSWDFFNGKYSKLLSANIIATVISFSLFFSANLVDRFLDKTQM